MECVLDGTPVSKCKVPPEPKVKAPKLNAEAAKLNGSTCKDGLCWKKSTNHWVTYYGTYSSVKRQCGTQACGKFIGYFSNYGYGPKGNTETDSPFNTNSIACGKKYGGDAHWCTQKEAEAFTKVDFVEMAKKAKEQQVSVSSGTYLSTACGKYDPNYLGKGKGSWLFTCARVDLNANSHPQKNVHPSFVTDVGGGNMYQYVGGSWYNYVNGKYVNGGAKAWQDTCRTAFGMCCGGSWGQKVDH